MCLVNGWLPCSGGADVLQALTDDDVTKIDEFDERFFIGMKLLLGAHELHPEKAR